jgi:hypothetical protein
MHTRDAGAANGLYGVVPAGVTYRTSGGPHISQSE